MRRAVSLTRVSSLSRRPRQVVDTAGGNGEYVVNRTAIAASLLLSAVLVGVPAAVYTLWPTLFVGEQQQKDTRPLLVTVQQEVNRAPPPPADTAMLEAIREKQARETEARAVQRRNATRRRVRARRESQRSGLRHLSSDDLAVTPPADSPAVVDDLETAASDAAPTPTRLLHDEAELLVHLRENVPELRVDDDGAWSKKLFASRSARSAELGDLLDSSKLRKLVSSRADLAGLPFRWDKDCKIDGERRETLRAVSKEITALNPRGRTLVGTGSLSHSADPAFYRFQQLLDWLHDSKKWSSPEHVPALEQTLQIEGESIVLSLVDAFLKIEGKQAAQALARRALYDVSPEVRTRAIEVLRSRNPQNFQGQLMSGLRYPWGAVAVNAADALVELQLEDAVPELVEMLEQPEPTAPHRDEQGRWVVRELVKVNHMRNCTLCHAPATDDSPTSINGFVPTPGKSLPAAYYGARSGNFVRADVTYLRQDFSLMESVEKARPWPKLQRFDFLVRTRLLTEDESAQREAEQASSEQPSQHREALLYALRGLTGKDGGEDPQRWRELLGLVE